MYRKSMRKALQEARAYRDPLQEDKGFSSQQIKMAYGILNDPRYKQGNYSGAVKAIEKIAKGLSNHPDVANALKRANEELDEALEVKWDSNKQGWFDKQGRRRYLGNMATNKLMSKAIDKAKETGDFINPFKLKHGQKPEETDLKEGYEGNILHMLRQKGIKGRFSNRKLYLKKGEDENAARLFLKLKVKDRDDKDNIIYGHEVPEIIGEETELEEAFTRKDFAKLEADNEHTEAAEKLINMFGTKEEKFAMAAIKARHNMTGYIKGPDYNKRQMMVNKYYSRLK